jgi:uncharacterized protein (DUF2141 family)
MIGPSRLEKFAGAKYIAIMLQIHALRGVQAVTLGLAIAVVTVGASRAAQVDVHVTGVPNPRGHVRVELCTRQTFLTDACPYTAAAPATVGDTVVQLSEVPPGEYAIQAFDDDLDAGHVHQNILGIPRERVGFSNDAPLHVQGPSFSEAAFKVGEGAREVTLRLRKVLFGPKN